MPATHHIDGEARLITTVWEGEATDAEFMTALNKYHVEIQSNPEYARYNDIVDLTDASPLNLTISGLLALGRIASDADTHTHHKKMAIIIASDFAYMLANMYISYRNLGDASRKKIAVFKNESDAFHWIRNDSV